MKQGFFEQHWTDADGTPAGGVSSGRGIAISWQKGALGRHSDLCARETEREKRLPSPVDHTCFDDCDRSEANGAFVEDVIGIVVGRIEHYESSRFACRENKTALKHLRLALEALNERTKSREARQVEGTHRT